MSSPSDRRASRPQTHGLLATWVAASPAWSLINVVIWGVIGLANGGHWPHFWPVWLLIPWAIIVMGQLGKRR